MKVSQAIRILTNNYELDDNIIIDWWAHDEYEEDCTEEFWDNVVSTIEMDDKLEYSHEQVHNIISETILEEKGEI